MNKEEGNADCISPQLSFPTNTSAVYRELHLSTYLQVVSKGTSQVPVPVYSVSEEQLWITC